MSSIYDPSTYPRGVPNPYGPRVHAWNDGPYAQGTRYHGSVWTRPMWGAPWRPRPFAGLGQTAAEQIPPTCWNNGEFTSCYQRLVEEAFDWCGEEVSVGYPRWQQEYGSIDACADRVANEGTLEFCVPKYCPQGKSNLPWILAGVAGIAMIGVAVSLNRAR